MGLGPSDPARFHYKKIFTKAYIDKKIQKKKKTTCGSRTQIVSGITELHAEYRLIMT